MAALMPAVPMQAVPVPEVLLPAMPTPEGFRHSAREVRLTRRRGGCGSRHSTTCTVSAQNTLPPPPPPPAPRPLLLLPLLLLLLLLVDVDVVLPAATAM